MKAEAEFNLKRGARSDAVYLSISQIAAVDGSTRETVSKRLDKAGATPAGKRGGWPVYDLRVVWPIFLRGQEVAGVQDPDQLDPIQRKAHYAAEREKRNLQLEAGELHRNVDCAAETARRDKMFALTLDTLPDLIERDCGATPQMVALIEVTIDKLRTLLADGLQAPEEAPLDEEDGEKA